MRKLLIPITLFILSFLIIGIQVRDTFSRISKEEAEGIALDEAKSLGYQTANLWTQFENETRLGYVYSAKYNKDMKIWKVSIDTDEHPDILNTPAMTLFISVDCGEVIAIINADEGIEK